MRRLPAELRMSERAEEMKSVIDRDKHDAGLGKPSSVVYGMIAGATAEPAAVNPDHDRKRCIG